MIPRVEPLATIDLNRILKPGVGVRDTAHGVGAQIQACLSKNGFHRGIAHCIGGGHVAGAVAGKTGADVDGVCNAAAAKVAFGLQRGHLGVGQGNGDLRVAQDFG